MIYRYPNKCTTISTDGKHNGSERVTSHEKFSNPQLIENNSAPICIYIYPPVGVDICTTQNLTVTTCTNIMVENRDLWHIDM